MQTIDIARLRTRTLRVPVMQTIDIARLSARTLRDPVMQAIDIARLGARYLEGADDPDGWHRNGGRGTLRAPVMQPVGINSADGYGRGSGGYGCGRMRPD
jgi:hypothetical protein